MASGRAVKKIVLFDAQVLMDARHSNLCRTGVYRVAKAFWDFFKRNPDVIAIPYLRLSPDTTFRKLRRKMAVCAELGCRRVLLGEELAKFIHRREASDAGESIIFSPFHPLPTLSPRAPSSPGHGLRKVIVIYDLIAILHPEYFEGVGENVLAQALRSIDASTSAFCISKATEADLVRHIPELIGRTHVFLLAAENAIFYHAPSPTMLSSVQERLALPPRPYILALSTLEPRKNTSAILDAYELLCERAKDPPALILIGEKGWGVGEVVRRAHALATKWPVFLTGYVDDKDLASLYSNALCFVYPSFYEGFGLPPLEAMACGTPVIVSNTSSLPEVVGDAGLYVNPEKPQELFERMLEVILSPDLRRTLSQKSLARAKLFSWQRSLAGGWNEFVICSKNKGMP